MVRSFVLVLFLDCWLELLCLEDRSHGFTIRRFMGKVLPSRHEMFLRDLNQISIERDISETSQKHLKRDVFFVTSLRRLKNISKKMSFV